MMTALKGVIGSSAVVVALAWTPVAGNPQRDYDASNSAPTYGLVLAAALEISAESVTVGIPERVASDIEVDLEQQRRAVEFLHAIASDHEQEYVSSGVGRAPDGSRDASYWINFTEQPPPAVMDSISTQEFQTTVSWGLSANAATVSRAAEVLGHNLVAARVSDLIVGPSSGPGASGITVSLAVPTDSSGEDVVRSAIESTNSSLALADSLIHVVWDDAVSPASFQATIRGGEPFAGCTTGFAANYAGDVGVVTAGHCDNAGPYNGSSGVLLSATVDAHPSLDIQFNPRSGTIHTVTKDFRSTPNTITAVTGVGSPVMGQGLCKYGKVTGNHCGASNPLFIDETNQCRFFDGLYVCNAWSTNRVVTQDGDSGGPWYVGGTAYGLTIGAGRDGSWLTGAGVLAGWGFWVRRN